MGYVSRSDGADRLRSRLTRRKFLQRSVVMGAAVPAAASLLAACGGDDDSTPTPRPEPTATVPRVAIPTPAIGGQVQRTPTPGEAATAEPAATSAPVEPTATTAEADSRGGGEMVLLGHHQIASLSPDDAGPTVHWVMVTQIHNAMLELDSWYGLEPVLAESWEVTDDGMEYTFNLRQDVTFHDGEGFSSADVEYTFTYYSDPANAAIQANNFQGMASVETPDDYTVVVSMDAPNAAFVTRAAQTFIVPEHHHSAIGEDAYKGDPIGTGPYKLREWRAAEYTVVEAFDDHFRGRPLIDTVRESIVPEASVRAVALRTGEADSSVWALVTEDHVLFRNDASFRTYVTSSLAVNHFPMNNTLPQFQEKVVRQAMMYAIDRDRIVDDLWSGLAVKATANLSPALDFYYEPNVTQYDFNPELARQMLDDAGWLAGSDGIREKDGVRLEWDCAVITGDQARRPVAEVVQQDLLDVGMNMQITETPAASAGMRDQSLDMSLYNWTYGGGSGEPDAAGTLRSDGLNNFSHYSNPRMDELLDQGLSESDPERRREIYSEVQQIVAEDVPFLFIKYWDWFTIFSPRVKGLPEEDILAGSQIYNMIYTFWLED